MSSKIAVLRLFVALERLQRGALDHRDVVAGEVVVGEQLPHLDLDELEQLGVVHHVDLVQEDDDVGHVHLPGEQHVLAGLRHRAVGGGHDEDRPVHLRGAGDHVLDVVVVARAVDVRVVALVRRILDVRGRDRDAALPLLGSLVDLVELRLLRHALLGQHLREGGRQRRLAVVDVTDRAHIHVGLVALELLLRHFLSSLVAIDGLNSRHGPPSGRWGSTRANRENIAGFGRRSGASRRSAAVPPKPVGRLRTNGFFKRLPPPERRYGAR